MGGAELGGGILLLAEPAGSAFNQLHPVIYELLGKARELVETGAMKPSPTIGCLALGPEDLALEELPARGCDVVYHMSSPCFSPPLEERFAANIAAFVRKTNPGVVLIGATSFGRSLAPRVAAALQAGLTADCTQLRLETNMELIQIRPAFSGNILAHIRSDRRPQMATIRYKEFLEADRTQPKPPDIRRVEPYATEWEASRILRLLPPTGEDITEAEVIVAAGRGVRKKEDLALLRELAELLGGQLGVSRALVDAGLADSAIQVGYSGHRVKPRLYIACGISGAPQHLAGMKEAETIVVVNSDASAPIFSHCHYGLMGDLYDVVPRMIEDLKSWKEAGKQ